MRNSSFMPREEAVKGLQIWASSLCRSTLDFYACIGAQIGLPFRICLGQGIPKHRELAGFRKEEFAHLELVELDGSKTDALAKLTERQEWHQLFGVYQTGYHLKAALSEALMRQCRVAIASEAPCNMFQPGFKRLAKTVYFSSFAKLRLKYVIDKADFLINWSGDDAKALLKLGWDPHKIVPLGYFSPPLEGSSFKKRDDKFRNNFQLLCTGNMTWHRGSDILLKALVLLKDWGIPISAIFTSEGPLMGKLQETAAAHVLDCEFAGFVSMQDLTELYQSCSVFVAPGRAEPWGMRVNDALHCGAPVIISRGMGAQKLVDDYGLGSTFANGDYVDLAWQIRRMVTDADFYGRINRNLELHRNALMPDLAANRALSNCAQIAPDWSPANGHPHSEIGGL